MKKARFAALILALVIPVCSLAEEASKAIQRLTDADLVKLWCMVTEETCRRGISADELTRSIKPFSAKMVAQEKLQAAQGAYNGVKETPVPTFAPLIHLSDEDTVWISKSGKRYHTKPDCSGMRTAKEVTLSEAIAKELTPCRDCAYWLDFVE